MKMVYVLWLMKERELHMVREEEGNEKRQLIGPEPATSRPRADPLAAEARSQPSSILALVG